MIFFSNFDCLRTFPWETFHVGGEYGDTELISEKAEALYAELNERAEAAISSCSATGEVLQYIYYICTCG